MPTRNHVGRAVAAALATGALFAAVAPALATAYPLPLTGEDTNYLNAAHASGFPGDDDVLLIVGRQMCRQLFSGQSASDVIGSISGEYGASPAQTATVLRAARNAYCTSAPG